MMGIGAMLSVGFVKIMSLDYQLTSIFV
jgi:exocyst complex component 2